MTTTTQPAPYTTAGKGAASDLDLQLLERYAGRGPRYTSYPPATAWRDDVGASDLIGALHGLRERERPADLAFYVHMPFCPSMCWFCACNVLITKRGDLADRYLDRLEVEVDRVAEHLPPDARLVQLHWGGGSPTYMTPGQMRRLHHILTRHVQLAPDIEQAIEVDPRITTLEHLETLRELGFNRLSMGIQDFDDAVQQAIGRPQSAELTSRFVQRCRSVGFDSLNCDLIYGLPKQTPVSFAHTLDLVCELEPERLAVYGYAHVPWLKPFQRKIDDATLPDAPARLRLFREALLLFLDEGYEYIGLDHFARPWDELAIARRNGTLQRNFMGYTTAAGTELVGFGLSSISLVDGLYAQNEHKLNPYYAAVDGGGLPVERGYRLTADDRMRADIIQDLMCRGEIDKDAIEARHGVDFDVTFADALRKLEPLAADGLVTLGERRIEVTRHGRILVRPVAMCFDAHLQQAVAGQQRFSSTV